MRKFYIFVYLEQRCVTLGTKWDGFLSQDSPVMLQSRSLVYGVLWDVE